ncbi:MAG: putative glycolipid-binding domain-containing protein [Rhizobiaceae bacterium]|nr:putative glycolipid-binding domain-containing protein [Rhizobiaceae bacterium]
MERTEAAVFWERLDTAGHDSCRLLRTDDGFALEGSAVFEHQGAPCALTYRVVGDSAWQTHSGLVSGFVGDETIGLDIVRTTTGDWLLNGDPQPEASGLPDLDLGFTPATNLIAIRRFALVAGDRTPAPAAYIFFPETRPPDLRLTRMDQTYHRLDAQRYDYTGIAYREVLTVSAAGFVTDYPGLWSGRVWPPAHA